MRGTTLATLVTMLKAELGESLSVGTQSDALYKQLLQNEQKLLVAERAFPFLETRWPVNLVAGTKSYAFPTTTLEGVTTISIDFERPLKVECNWNERLQPVEYGIGIDEYNTFDSFATPSERTDPVQRWRYNGSADFEVWPVPATSSTGGIRFTGQRALSALSADGDTAMLDDEMLVLSVATKRLAMDKHPASQLLLSQMNRRLSRLFANYPTNHNPIILGRQQADDRRTIRTAKLVLVA